MGIVVYLIKTKSEEYNQCAGRMDKLITKLNGDRAKRVASRQSQNASVLNIVQLFQEEEERKITTTSTIGRTSSGVGQ